MEHRQVDLPLPPNLNCIVASHSLEHFFLDDLSSLLRIFYDALSESGIFLLEVPNHSLMRNYYFRGNHAPHTIFFSPESLDIILQSIGFKAIFLIDPGTDALKLRQDACYFPRKHKKLTDSICELRVLCFKQEQIPISFVRSLSISY